MQNPLDSRYADLVRLLRRYGRSDLVSGAQLDEFSVDDTPGAADAGSADTSPAEQLADDLERMGPTFVKLGQLLSTRFDLLPVEYTTALARLQDTVEPIPFADVRAVVEAELGAPIGDRFSDFAADPIASASIGQVHAATLRNGHEVVVKVQRPGVRDTVRDDMEVLTRLAALADDHTDVGRRFGFGQLLAQFRRSLAGELDYRREAKNLETFVELTADYDRLVVPRPVLEYTTSRLLTMDRVHGRKVTDIGRLGLVDLDARPVVEQLFRAYLRMILDKGVLHADPHPGNLLVMDDGRVALLDLGMTAFVPPRIQDELVKLLLAISDGDGGEVATILLELGRPVHGHDPGAFRDEVSHLVSDSVARGADLQVGTVLVRLSRLCGVHGLRPPAELSMIGRAMLNLDQATSHLDPTFAPAQCIRDNVSEIFATGLKASPGGLLSAAIETKNFTAALPARANRILDAMAAGEFRVRVDAIDEERLHLVLHRVANRLTLGLVIAAMLVGAAFMMRVPSSWMLLGYPGIAIVFFLLAAGAGIALAVWIVVTDRRVVRSGPPGRAPVR